MEDERPLHRVFGLAARRTTLFALLAATVPLLAAKIVEFPLANANSQPYTICLGPDGRLWFTEVAGNRIGAMTTAGVISEYTIPDANSAPLGIAPDPGGTMSLAFTKSGLGTVGYIFTNGGFGGDDPSTFSGPHQVVAGPDGRLWVTETTSSKIYALKFGLSSPASKEMATITAAASPIGIAAAINLNVFFTEDAANKIGVASTEVGSVQLERTIPTPASHPRRLVVVGPFVWVTENGSNKIGRWSAESDQYDEFTIPTAASAPLGICQGPDGNVWFTEHDGNKIGRVTPAGVITEYTIPTGGSGPSSICTGPDGNLYFTENSANKIGKLDVFIPGDTNDDGTVDVADVFYTINFLFAGGPAPK